MISDEEEWRAVIIASNGNDAQLVLESNIMSIVSQPWVSSSERRWLIVSSIGVLILASLPYLIGVLSATPDRIFTGLQVNPLDGVSYLAKMRLGYHGEWLFHLTFTIEHGSGAFLFTFFIALGHLARLLNLPLMVIFHAARVIGGFVLLWMIYQLIARFTDSIALRYRMWWLVALSSGLGWIAALLGYGDSTDLTIPESNTFYSLIANAHFALATAIMIVMFLRVIETRRVAVRNVVWVSVLSLALAIIQPFAPFAVYAIIGTTLLVMWRRDRVFPRSQFTAAFISGLITAPLLLYMYLATQSDPTLRMWSMQNQTPSPPVVDYLIGYGLLFILAMPGARLALQRRSDWDILLIVWIVITIPMLYAPIPLQRRLSLGLHIPIAMLAAQGLSRVIRGKWLRRAVMAATIPTSIFIVLVLIRGAVTHDPHIYVTSDEAAALTWLQANAKPDAIVLAAPETGTFIPAFAGQRVVYGHPYETVEAVRKKQLLSDFFAGRVDQSAVLRDSHIDYVLLGPRERSLGSLDPGALALRSVFTSGDVALYSTSR